MELRTVAAIGPHQLTPHGAYVTVTVDDGVLSVQPDGRIEVRPPGTAGPYELAINAGDRLVYAPHGVDGAVYLLPLVTAIPNV